MIKRISRNRKTKNVSRDTIQKSEKNLKQDEIVKFVKKLQRNLFAC